MKHETLCRRRVAGRGQAAVVVIFRRRYVMFVRSNEVWL